MATVIRLKPGGRTHAPYYRFVVCDSRAKITGRVIDRLGVYHPCARPEPRIEIDEEATLDWLKKGAQPTPTVRNVLKRKGILQRAAVDTVPASDQESNTPSPDPEGTTNE